MSADVLKKINESKSLSLNTLPVITWRWLRVNEFNLKDFKIDELTSYEKNFIKSAPSEGVTISKVRDNLRYFEVEKYFKSKERIGVSEDFVRLAEAHSNAEALIHVDRGVKASEPVILSFTGDSENPMVIDHNLIIAEDNSEITVIIDYSTEGSSAVFHNGLTKIYAKDGAVVNLIKVQTLNDFSINLDSNVSYVGYGAKVNYISVELGSDKSLTSYITNLEKDTAQSELKSIYLTDGTRYTDMSYIMNMIGRRTLSNITTYGALKDRAKKIFRGTLDFKKGSARSKASEEEFATLLDRTVKSDAVPLLLCSEDDVEGAHAASAGRIDEDKLFYLMSRGFSEKEAKKLIVESSFRPIVDEIPVEELREQIQDLIDEKLVNG
jgi:FeS assembly protein SufD